MTLPDEYVPDEAVVVEQTPVCPGCETPLGPAARQYIAVEHRGETYCRRCVFRDHDAVVEADGELLCPGCEGATAFRRRADRSDRLCHLCGAKFRIERAAAVPGGGDR